MFIWEAPETLSLLSPNWTFWSLALDGWVQNRKLNSLCLQWGPLGCSCQNGVDSAPRVPHAWLLFTIMLDTSHSRLWTTSFTTTVRVPSGFTLMKLIRVPPISSFTVECELKYAHNILKKVSYEFDALTLSRWGYFGCTLINKPCSVHPSNRIHSIVRVHEGAAMKTLNPVSVQWKTLRQEGDAWHHATTGWLTFRWKHATMGSFFIVSCLVDSW